MKKYDKPEFEVVFYDEKDNIMLSAADVQVEFVGRSYNIVLNLNS